MRHPVFLLMDVLDTVQRCTLMSDSLKLDLRTKTCGLMQQCITHSTSAYDFHADAACPCMYTQVRELASLVPGACAVERELHAALQVISCMLLTSSLTGCLQLPLPCDLHCEEWMQANLREEIARLT